MKVSDFFFTGIRGSVVALNRATGEQKWATHLKGYDFVNIAVLGERILATCYGEIFCLDPLTGNGIWHNRLKGYGTGLATVAASNSPGDERTPAQAEKHRRDQEAAANSGATT